jgi:hypothetical protein
MDLSAAASAKNHGHSLFLSVGSVAGFGLLKTVSECGQFTLLAGFKSMRNQNARWAR